MTQQPSSQQLEYLAATIGDEIYMDVAKWHLYLKDAKLHTPLAEHLAPLLIDHALEESEVVEILNQIPISLGGGRRELPLFDLLPRSCLADLMERLAEVRREWS